MKNRHGVRLLTFGSVPVYLKPSWFVLMIVVIAGYGLYLVQNFFISYSAAFTISTTLALLIALGVFIHEMAHAVCGIARGLRVEYISMTLWGGLTKLSPGSPLTSLLVSLAGPLINALYALILHLLAHHLAISPVQIGVSIAAEVNLLISLFNMIPSYPLDGGHSLEAVITHISKRRYIGAKVTAYTGLVLIPLLLAVTFFYGVWSTALGLTMVIIVCYYIFSASYPVAQALRNQSRGTDPFTVAHLTVAARVVPEDTTLAELTTHRSDQPVITTREGIATGWISAETLKFLLEHEAPSTVLTHYAYPLAPTSLPENLLRIDLMDYFNGYRYQQLPVNMRTGYTPIAWAVGEPGHYRGLITHRALAESLTAERA